MTFEGSYKAPDNSDVLPITHRSFDNDAIMFTDTPGLHAHAARPQVGPRRQDRL